MTSGKATLLMMRDAVVVVVVVDASIIRKIEARKLAIAFVFALTFK